MSSPDSDRNTTSRVSLRRFRVSSIHGTVRVCPSLAHETRGVTEPTRRFSSQERVKDHECLVPHPHSPINDFLSPPYKVTSAASGGYLGLPNPKESGDTLHPTHPESSTVNDGLFLTIRTKLSPLESERHTRRGPSITFPLVTFFSFGSEEPYQPFPPSPLPSVPGRVSTLTVLDGP